LFVEFLNLVASTFGDLETREIASRLSSHTVIVKLDFCIYRFQEQLF
jgi:hypothetical protein